MKQLLALAALALACMSGADATATQRGRSPIYIPIQYGEGTCRICRHWVAWGIGVCAGTERTGGVVCGRDTDGGCLTLGYCEAGIDSDGWPELQ